MGDFAFPVPLYLLAEVSNAWAEESGEVGFQSSYTETGLQFMPVFTEPLFAERWIAQVGAIGRELYAVPTLHEFATILEKFKTYGPPYVGIDPDMTYRKYAIRLVDEVLDSVRQQAAAEEDAG
jgi:hypothetical protein